MELSGSIFIYNCCGLTIKNPKLSLSGTLLFDPSRLYFFAVKAPPAETIGGSGFSPSVFWNIFSSSFLWFSGSLSIVCTLGVIKVLPRPFLPAVSWAFVFVFSFEPKVCPEFNFCDPKRSCCYGAKVDPPRGVVLLLIILGVPCTIIFWPCVAYENGPNIEFYPRSRFDVLISGMFPYCALLGVAFLEDIILLNISLSWLIFWGLKLYLNDTPLSPVTLLFYCSSFLLAEVGDFSPSGGAGPKWLIIKVILLLNWAG